MLLAVAAFYAAVVALRVNQNGTLWFVHIGRAFTHSAHTSARIDSIHEAESRFGYDGQFYFYIAADPAHAHDYMHYGGKRQAGIRYARIIYPALSYVFSGGGSLAALPIVMLTLNLLAIGAGTWAVGRWLQLHGRSTGYAALYGLWPGLVFAVCRDLSEPLAYCFVAFAVLAFARGRFWWSAAWIATSLLTRETAIAFAVGLALAYRRRSPAFLAAAIVPMIVWRGIVSAWLGETTLESTESGWHAVVPFYGLYAWRPFDWQHWLLVLTVYVPFLLIALGAAWLVLRRRELVYAPIFLLNVALFVVWLPKNVVIDWGAAGRNATPVLLAALYLAPAVRSRILRGAGAFFVSMLWYLVAAAWLGGPGFHIMTT